MKKFRRIISGFLAAALILTQSMTTAYSDDLPDAAGTTTSAAETTMVDTEGEADSTTGETSASDDETSQPEEGDPEDTDTDTTESADGDEKGEDDEGEEVEYIEITALPTKTVYFIGDDFDLSGGKFTVYHANGESEELDMAEELSRETLAVTGYDAATLGEQTIILTYLEKTVSFTVSVVADPENDTETESATYADGSSAGALTLNGVDYPNFEQAFAAVEANEANIIYINENISVPYGEFTLPTAAQIGTGSLWIQGNTVTTTLTLNGVTSLSPGYGFRLYDLKLVPLDSNGDQLTSFTISGSKNVTMDDVTIDTATTVNVSVSGVSELISELIIESTSAKFGTLTGTTKSNLSVYNSSITADKVTTFSLVDANSPITVTTSMTGVATLVGNVTLHDSATATITTFRGGNITLLDDAEDGLKFAKPTITNVIGNSTFTVKESTGTNPTIALPSGTPIFTFNGTEAQFDDCKGLITITNTSATGKELTPYYYNKEIRAEWAGMLTLNVGLVEKGSFPNFEKAFAAVEANKPYHIYINEDINVPYGKFTLPTAAQIGTGSIIIMGKTGRETLTLNGVTSLSPGYDFTLYNLTLIPLDSNGKQLTSFTISGSKYVEMQGVTIAPATTVNVSVGAGSVLNIVATSAKFGTLTGTTTSILTVTGTSITADKVTTFSTVAVSTPITVTTSMTGVGELSGGVILHATATATITTLNSANITLLDDAADGLKLAKPTITNVAYDSTFTVKDSTGASTIPVPSGTLIFTFNGTEAQFDACKNYITITNTTATEKELTPWYYNKEIRAEWAGMLTLYVGGEDRGSFPNFEKAFAAVEANRVNDICINEDINVPYGKFTLPTNLGAKGSLQIYCKSDNKRTLTLNGVTSLSPGYNFTLRSLTLVPLDSSGKQLTSFTISGSKKVLMQAVTIDPATTVNVSVGAGSNLMIWDSSTVKFGALTGTTTSDLEVHGASITADKVTTFSTVNAYFPITVNTSMTGVGELYGDGGVILPATATATITTIKGGNITLLADENGKFAKPTITNITGDSTFTVKDSTGASTIPVPSGTPIFTFNGTEAQFDDCKNNIAIENKTATEKELTPYYYNKEVRAEWAGMLTLKVDYVETGSFPNFEKAFAAVEANKRNHIYINEDINVPYGKFTLPTAAQIGTGSLNICGSTGDTTLTLNGVTSLSPRYQFTLNNLTLVPLDSSGKQLTSFTISGSNHVEMQAVTIDPATTVNVSVGAGSSLMIGNCSTTKFGTLTGTTTSILSIGTKPITADKVTTFSIVYASAPITVTTSMTGVGELSGGVILHATATATITTFKGGNITLLADENGKFAKPTITNITGDSTFTVKDSTGASTIAVPSGTPIFTFNGTEAQFDACKELISIKNKIGGETGNSLTPYYYNKEVRAEYDGVLTLNDKNYPNFEKAFAAVEANEVNIIYINENINVPYGKFTLPTNLGTDGSLKIEGKNGSETLTLNGVTSLSPIYSFDLFSLELVPLDRYDKQLTSFTISGSKGVSLGNLTIDTATTVNISVGAGNSLYIYGCPGVKFGTLTGTTTSILKVSNSSITADKVTTFGTVNADDPITVNTSMTGVGDLYGGVILPATATATITTLIGANITLRAETDTNGNITKLAKPTITNVIGASITVKDSTGANIIGVPSGTPIFTFNGTEAQFDACKDKITITNKTATDDTGKTLTPYYYNKEIRAEYEGMLTLSVGGEEKGSFPNFEKAFAAVEANKENFIWINEDINVPYGKFTLPTAAQIGTGSLNIWCDTVIKTLTLNGVTSLSPGYDFGLNYLKLVPLDRYGKQLTSFTISGSKGVSLGNLTIDPATTVNVSVGADSGLTIEATSAKFGALTGTTTSDLYVRGSLTADKVTTFSFVDASAPITVNTSMTGVGELFGEVILPATATATITNLGTSDFSANITLLAETDTNGNITKLPTVTVSNASTEITVTVKDSKTDDVIAVPSGTKLLKAASGSANYTAYLKIQNESTDGKHLNATLVGYDIVADDGDGAELQINRPDGTPITTAIYPSLALALASVNKNAKNVIVLHKDDKLVTSYLPTGVGADFSLDIISPFNELGEPEEPFTIDLNGNTSLSASVDIMFNNVKFMSIGRYDNPVNAITISSSKDLTAFNIGLAEANTYTNVTFSVTGKDSYLGLGDIGFTPSISGSRYDYGWFESQTDMTVKDIKNISGFGPSAGTTLTVTGTVSGVTDITSGREDGKTAGVVKFAPSAAATVTNMTAANIVLEKSTDDALPKFTVTNAYKDENVANVITVNDSTESVPSGTPVFRMACSERVFYNSGYSSNITIANKDGEKALNAFYYNGEIRAEYAGALTLFEGETEIGKYPNFTLAFKAMSAGTAAAPKQYKLFVNEDIETATFTLPSLAANDSLEITGSGKITFKGLSAISSGFHLEFTEITLEPVKADGTAAETFNINSSASLTLSVVTIANSCKINASAGRNSTLSVKYFIGSLNELKGTTTTELDLKSPCEINKINTFATVTFIDDFADVKVRESITGVTKLTTLDSNAELRIASTATATIGTIDKVHVSLIAETDGESPVIPKLNVTTINNASTVTVQNSSYENLTLASGTPIFRCTDTETNFYRNSAGAFTINNKTADGKKLDAYYYGGEIRAEVTGEAAVTLTVMTRNGGDINTDFTTLDKALNAAKKDCGNIITLKKSLEVSSIALPSGLGSRGITITADQSADTKPTLTFKGMTRLSAQCDICFEDIELIFLDRSGNALNTFAVSSTFGLYLNSVKTATKLSLSSTGKEIYIQKCDFEIGTISGNSSKTALLTSGNLTADAVNSFASVGICFGALTVNNTLSSVSTLQTPGNGSLVLKPTATATIGTIRSYLEHVDPCPANIVLCAEQNEDGSIKKLAALTVSTDITSEGGVKGNVFVKNEDASALIPVPSGTKIFTFSGTEQKFNEISGNMQIVNTTTGDDSTKETYAGKKLDPFYYSREIRAEYAGMLTLNVDNVKKGSYPNFEKAFAAVEANKANNITINEDINVPYGKFTLPTNLGTNGSLSILGNSKKLTLNGVTSLSPRYYFQLFKVELVPLDRYGNQLLTSFTISGSKDVSLGTLPISPTTTVNVSVGAGSSLMIGNCSTTKFGTLTGTTTSTLRVFGSSITADKVTTFGTVNALSPIAVNTSMTGVDILKGDSSVILPATATATITTLNYVNIILLDDAADGLKLAKPTITNVVYNSAFTVKDSTGTNTIAVPSGTPIFTFNGTEAQFDACKEKISITNKTATGESGKELTPYYYSREIRAEYEGMLTLNNGTETRNFPNFEKAFAAVEANKVNNILINEDINVPYGKFTLPTNLGTNGSLEICSESENTKTLTLNGVTSLSPRYHFGLSNLTLVPLDRNSNKLTSFTISGSKIVTIDGVTIDPATTVNVSGTTLTIANGSNAKFGTLSGTTTSSYLTVIQTSITADKVTTFSVVTASPSITVTTSMTGVGELYGGVILPATATATITTLNDTNITLLAETDEDGNITKLAKPTITNVTGNSTFTVKKPVVNENGEITSYENIAVPSGTPIFTFNGTEAQFNTAKTNNMMKIVNRTEAVTESAPEAGNELTPWYYSREIRAEYEGMLTLIVDEVDKGKYPNFEKAFAAVEANKVNNILINEDINVPYGKFTLPTNLGTDGKLFIQGNNGSKKLTLNGVTSLSPRYNFEFGRVELVPLDRNGKKLTSFTISGSNHVVMETVTIDPATTVNVSVGALYTLFIHDCPDTKFGTLTGTTTSYLNIGLKPITADKVTTFSNVYLGSSLTVKTSMTGVGVLYGDGGVILPATATATITNLGISDYSANITLLAETDEDGNITKLPNLTVTNIAVDSSVTVKKPVVTEGVTTYEAIPVPSGTKIFTFNGTEAQFDACKDKISITNKTATGESGKPLTPYYYSREIRAEYEGMLTLRSGGVDRPFPNFEKAFAAVEANKANTITINEDINVPYGKFTLPTNLGANGSLEIYCESENTKTLTLNGVTSLSPRYHFGLSNLTLVPLDRNSNKLTSFTISGSKIVTIDGVTIDPATTVNVSGTTLTIANGSNAKFGTLSGTTTSSYLSVIQTSITADKVTTFGIVTASPSITVNTSMTGVGELYGGAILPATATATITNLGYSNDGANITLLAETDENGNITKLAKPTITNVTGNSTFTVKKPVVNENGEITSYETIAVPSGTPIFTFNGTEAQFDACKEKISITNKTEGTSGSSLSPCYYNKEIRAEVPDVIELYVEGEMVSSFTSFEKLFQRITTLANSDRTNQNDYVVVLCDSVTSKVFTLPTYGASFTVKSEGTEQNSLTLIGATISYKNYPVHFENVDLSVVKAA